MDLAGPDPAAGTAEREGWRKDYDAFISYARKADGAFATALQRGLHHLAKPWNRRRVMEVFRDQTSLPASSGLLPSIRSALDASRWFVLLASPESAQSNWVGEEITHWVSSKGADHMLIVLTDGTWTWDKTSNDLSPASTARNPALCGVFAAEPNILNMTWARRNADLTLRNARFRDDVATLAAAIREVPKEEIEGEDVRQQRRTRRIVRAVIAALTVLVLLASVLAVVANIQRNEAIRQRDVAVSRLLINESETLGDTDPIISKLESIAAWRISPSDDARYAMLSAAARPGIRVAVLPAPGLPRYGFLGTLAGLLDTVAFSPDAKIMAIGGSDGTVRLWDVTSRQQIGGRLTGLTGPFHSVNSMAFSPDGKLLAAGSEDGRVWLWDVATHQQTGTPLAGDTGPVHSVAFSPDGKIVAAGSDDHTARLWDVATRQQIGTPLIGHTGPVTSVTFSKDGKTLATGSSDGHVRLWDVATRQQIGTPLAGGTGSVNTIVFGPHGKLLATGGKDGTVRLWDLATHRQVGTPLASNIGVVESMAVSPDGSTLATGSDDHTARLWNVATRQQIGTPLTGYTGPVTSVMFSKDGKTLATGSNDGTVRLWDVASVTGIATLVDPIGSVLSVTFSPDGKTVATGGYDHTARLWDVATRQQMGTPLTGHTGPVTSVAFSPDGKTLATGSDDHTVRLWDVTSRTVIATLTGHTEWVLSVAFSPDGKTLASGSADGTVRLWDVATHRQIGNPLIELVIGPGKSLPGDWVQSVAFSPDSKTLATVDIFGAVRLWNVATHRQIGNPLTINVGLADTVTFSPDGKTLASGGTDDTVRLWDVATRTVKATLTGHTAQVLSVAFSPDGKTLASGGRDDTVRLWDVATRQQIGAPLTGYGRWVTSVAFSPDGMTLAGGSNDYTVRFWNTAYLTNTVAVLCASVGRSLTRAEWAHYAPGPAYQNICPERTGLGCRAARPPSRTGPRLTPADTHNPVTAVA